MKPLAFSHASSPARQDTLRAYGQIAHRYDNAHRRWLRGGGQKAQDAFDGATAAIVQPGLRVLDAGCGTVSVAKRLIRLCHGYLDISLLDACPERLAQTGSVHAKRRLGCLEDIPFPQDQFDLVTSAWALEATRRPMNALRELVRVTRPGGVVCFVSGAEFGQTPLLQRLVHRNVQRRGLGRLLTQDELAQIPLLFPTARVQLLQVGHASVLGLIRPAPQN
ncbi:methyltransferase domain-containing protein [Aliiroseovarius sp. S1339]|uniref:class I SAM-dependent methyltransferase n=1 Tax=Aliiroseovarius sp. S1339 TaxID=2936990 RepID=UPI0020BEB2F2|nr:methyltransferase domain-containing protein [Aliiroseovarius sp. S1339]MCK8462930.1 methyltransferase domain-containing protein [Aliiroseovarius sp. S1339]